MRPHAARIAPACLVFSLGTGAAIAGGAPAAAAAASAAASTSSAQQTLSHALSAAKHEGSVRITVEFYSGSTTGKVVQDSTSQSGEQTVAIGKERASVVLVAHTAYISGNSQGMTSYFGLPADVVATLGRRWVSVRPSDAAYRSVAGNVTSASALANVTPTGNLTTGKRSTVNHQSVRSIVGAAPDAGRLTLFVAAGGRSLPVEAIESSGTGTSARGEIVTFTRWGERVTLPTPSPDVPISAIQGASSGAG